MNRDEVLMTVSDAARLLGIAANTLRTHANAGKLPCVRSSAGERMFKRGDVIRFREERHMKGVRRKS